MTPPSLCLIACRGISGQCRSPHRRENCHNAAEIKHQIKAERHLSHLTLCKAGGRKQPSPEEGFSEQEINIPWYQTQDLRARLRSSAKGSSELLCWWGLHWSLGLGTRKLHGNQENPQIFWEFLSRSFTLTWSCLLRRCQGRFSIRKGLMNSRVLSASSGPAHRCKPRSTAVSTDHLGCAHPLFQQLLGTSGKPGLCLQGESRADAESVAIDCLAFSRMLLRVPCDIAAGADSPGPGRDGEVSGRR